MKCPDSDCAGGVCIAEPPAEPSGQPPVVPGWDFDRCLRELEVSAEECRSGDNAAKELMALDLTDDERTKMVELQKLHDEYGVNGERVIALVTAGNHDEALRVSNDVLGGIEDRIFAALQRMVAKVRP